MTLPRRFVLGFLVAAMACVHAGTALASGDAGFPLDDVPRTVEAEGRIRCPDVDLVTFRGDRIRYSSPVRVFVGFRDRLRLFEQVVVDVATEVYGRPPRTLRHLGTYNCRRIRLWATYLSEHGLGNAVDVAGFDFGPLPRNESLPSDLPKSLRKRFQVRLDPHWEGQEGAAAVHARFLRTLADRLVARHDIFRVLLGPAYPGHKDHFHFDCAPWRLVRI